jgi:hypothetical protein
MLFGSIQPVKADQVARRGERQCEDSKRGCHTGILVGQAEAAAEAGQKDENALSGLESAKSEASKQGEDNGAGKIDGEQRHLRAE